MALSPGNDHAHTAKAGAARRDSAPATHTPVRVVAHTPVRVAARTPVRVVDERAE